METGANSRNALPVRQVGSVIQISHTCDRYHIISHVNAEMSDICGYLISNTRCIFWNHQYLWFRSDWQHWNPNINHVLVLYAFRSRFGAEALQSNGLTLKRDEWWICVNLAFPLQAPAGLVPSTPQSVSGENPASWKLPPRHRDFLLPRPCHCLRWTVLVRFNWISHPQ